MAVQYSLTWMTVSHAQSQAFVQKAKEEAEKAPLKWGQRREALVEESVSKAQAVQEKMLDAAWVVDWREQQVRSCSHGVPVGSKCKLCFSVSWLSKHYMEVHF